MSVIVYKDGESEKIDPQYLEQSLAVGWSLTPETLEPVPVNPLSVPENPLSVPDPAVDVPTQPDFVPENPVNEPTQPSNEEIRLMAQQAGVENWQTAQIKTLKSALGLPL